MFFNNLILKRFQGLDFNFWIFDSVYLGDNFIQLNYQRRKHNSAEQFRIVFNTPFASKAKYYFELNKVFYQDINDTLLDWLNTKIYFEKYPELPSFIKEDYYLDKYNYVKNTNEKKFINGDYEIQTYYELDIRDRRIFLSYQNTKKHKQHEIPNESECIKNWLLTNDFYLLANHPKDFLSLKEKIKTSFIKAVIDRNEEQDSFTI